MIRAIKWWLFMTAGFFLTALLTICPIEQTYQWMRPQWIFMFVIFCQILQPKYFNPLIAWMMGLLIDSLLGTPLGQYALVCAVISYLTSLLRSSFIHRPFWSQVEKVLLLVCLGQILILWFHAFAGHNPQTLWYWMGSLSSCLLWPFFVLTYQTLSQLFRVSAYTSQR
jgi:rod shape-determining protein MreD